ncbi:antitoxin YezG family protein [Bacillus thuringiensis]|nr:antitoxin YezG family protein [Bacillus thuringiensis]MED2808498.1 antitoxin YezG family protein [Bacillus thuringiensis]MED2827809.1 antitoxin YezG family protein [Bacillus thuringiensis]MED2833416.1 antitoxin YezG family protein [Bacillus thuringiensis]MED2849318.1 antitoxin YezG family protein [Bacillus thuringiensis]
MEIKLNLLYREIAETVHALIPEEWEKFYFYAQISEAGGGTYFFYNNFRNKENYKYSVEIPFKYEVNEEEFERKEDSLYKLSKELRNVFKDNQQELWYSFTMSLEHSGEFNMHFDYTNWLETEYSFSDQMIIWKRKYLGEVPINENDKALINKYNNEFPNNPI